MNTRPRCVTGRTITFISGKYHNTQRALAFVRMFTYFAYGLPSFWTPASHSEHSTQLREHFPSTQANAAFASPCTYRFAVRPQITCQGGKTTLLKTINIIHRPPAVKYYSGPMRVRPKNLSGTNTRNLTVRLSPPSVIKRRYRPGRNNSVVTLGGCGCLRYST